MNENDILRIAQLIIRNNYSNIDKKDNFINISPIYKFTNENITLYYKHLKNKKNILSVIGSGNQILNSVLSGGENIDCFDISVFPEYYLHLHIACILALSKQDYIKFFLSDDRNELFSDNLYEKVNLYLKGKYKTFWDNLFNFDEGYDIYNSLLFRQDFYNRESVIEINPYLIENNYYKLKEILKYKKIKINTKVFDITKTKIKNNYDLINLSNILYYKFNKVEDYMKYLKENFRINKKVEIINYFFNLDEKIVKEFTNYGGIIENIENNKLLIYKR